MSKTPLYPHRPARHGLRFVLGLVVAGCVVACDAPGGDLPAGYLGRWYYIGSSGGITGDGLGDEAQGYIVIASDGTIESFSEEGAPQGSAASQVSRGQTIFSTEDQWILTASVGLPQVLALSPDGERLSLSENVYDGIQRSYIRSR